MNLRKNDVFFMQAALDLAEHSLSRTSPNPRVGALVVRDNEIVGYGYHMRAGGPHAERYALDMAGNKTINATLYVTLEPCCHHGRTGPCTKAIIAAGISRVVVAMVDPHPAMAGQGIAQLEEAGIEVTKGVLEQEAVYLNDIYLKNIFKKQTFCSLKTAVTLDGRTATASGSSHWITNKKSRERVHYLRAQHDAVLTSVKTVLSDDCQLNVRLVEPAAMQPLRIVLDPNLEIPVDAKILAAQEAPTMIITQQECLADKKSKLSSRGAKICFLPHDEKGHVDLAELMRFLYQMGVMSVMVEAGSRLNKAFLTAELVDKFYVFIAPKFVCGQEAPGIFSGTGVANMANALELEVIKRQNFGNDILISAYPK
ncbi:MAG: bifunctional diaminohydroxyphosphoribosylaminopyrimidine deaminase/5-amino-6-(5-phosphoribosylamino)uracil reductase RibD [Bacillota bacterium]|jgi:diaminohydroxyphosphoribosylaminopyrimidine deaminase/5-amino-6-(5-phosphoribosylamino)uracil reductase